MTQEEIKETTKPITIEKDLNKDAMSKVNRFVSLVVIASIIVFVLVVIFIIWIIRAIIKDTQ
ncbi:hypothetical protein HY498_04855 [Candidatus Woesearchaeota archaeon]|nr:hypothetical protein [Candidatus Woesearchaeota archaeon]MBI4155384.1 hypothetical protein [Candidatus Woesearchaeota archaeon]